MKLQANKAFLVCLAAAALYAVAGIFFLLRFNLLLGGVNLFWAGLFMLGAAVCAQLSKRTRSRWWIALTALEAALRPWAPHVGLVLAAGFAAAAAIMLSMGNRLLFWVNVFWAVALPLAGFMWKVLGLRRTSSLCCLLAGLLYTMAAVFWYQTTTELLAWFNVFWGVTFLVLGYMIDRAPGVEMPSKPASEEDSKND